MNLNNGLVLQLNKKKWFKNTNITVKNKVLGKSGDGLLKFLVDIDEENEFGEIIKLTDYWERYGLFGVSFDVRCQENNQQITTKIINWKDGKNPLARGIILIEVSGKIKYLLLEKKFNLINFKNEIKSFSVAYPDFSDGKVIKLPQRIKKAIPDSTINKFIDLGYVYPEDSLIAGKTDIFALKVSIPKMELIDKTKVKMVELTELHTSIDIFKDAYLLAIITKLKFNNII